MNKYNEDMTALEGAVVIDNQKIILTICRLKNDTQTKS